MTDEADILRLRAELISRAERGRKLSNGFHYVLAMAFWAGFMYCVYSAACEVLR